jgi:hypothetical protein
VGRPDQLDAQLASRAVDRFSEQVISAADLPAARVKDVRESCELGISDDRSLLRLTCTITGSSYERPWDGSGGDLFALVDEASEETAHLIARTQHYAWLRSSPDPSGVGGHSRTLAQARLTDYR